MSKKERERTHSQVNDYTSEQRAYIDFFGSFLIWQPAQDSSGKKSERKKALTKTLQTNERLSVESSIFVAPNANEHTNIFPWRT